MHVSIRAPWSVSYQQTLSKRDSWANKMAQQESPLSPSLMTWVWSLGPTGWKKRTDFRKMSSHHQVYSLTYMHTQTHVHENKYNTKVKLYSPLKWNIQKYKITRYAVYACNLSLQESTGLPQVQDLRVVDLNLWVAAPLGVEWHFHRVCILDILPARYLHYSS